MNLKHLQAFVLACEAGSISGAARKLGKRQSQVSQWMSDLEIDLGVELFYRTGNQTSLSEAGEELLPKAVFTLSQAEILRSCADSLAQGEPVSLVIGLENAIPMEVIDQSISQFILAHSDVSLSLVADNRQALLSAMSNEEFDVVLLCESDQLHYPNLEYCRLGAYAETMVAAPTHPLAGKGPVSGQQLAQYRELTWSFGEEGNETGEGYSPIFANFSDFQSLMHVLQVGGGFSMLPQIKLQPFLDNESVQCLALDFEQSQISRRVEMLWWPGLENSSRGGALLQLLKTANQLD